MAIKTKPNIISVSRRTDIPAFYTSWFMQRIEAGHVLVPNPINPRQISRVSLRPSDVVGIVFWSKNPRPLISRLSELDCLGFRYYFQFTITSYPPDLEPNSPSWEDAVDTFLCLSRRLGPERVVWRYDPIILSETLCRPYHLDRIERTAQALQGAGNRLVISFLDVYRKTERNLRATGSPLLQGLVTDPPADQMRTLACEIASCAGAYGFQVEACAESLDLTACGVARGRCIDPALLGVDPHNAIGKDTGQRQACGCARSRDIGMYDSCLHGCTFCYANSSGEKAMQNRRRLHRSDAECLLSRATTPPEAQVHSASAAMSHDTAPEQLSLEGFAPIPEGTE